MKNTTFLLGILLFVFLSSFKTTDRACEYVGSNIEFIGSQTKKALSETDFNKTKFEIYKAINAIEKTKSKLKDCGCSYASKNLMEALDNLINATKISRIEGAKIFLNKALENSDTSLELLQQHHTHQSIYQHDRLSLNSKSPEASKLLDDRKLRQTIDTSLKAFETSIHNIVTTVDCEAAKKYLLRVYSNCETELLNEKLSEGKKYYNLRTKAITAEALKKLNCS
ncbi:hypothetical protein [Cellulophaga sp. Hel_I_12]|uniref:hypothetical protein n=1 Tax=Cellulophaga sp. Hel_I_12 TaxID=1249972 RepID=UPI0006481A4E|nr:hypothetical protein [Cellulophaga sp. Hel_I_12]